MKPIDKAKELLWKYLPIIEGWTSKEKTDLAKECALICVDEILNSNPHSNPFNTDVYSTMDYWQEVKKEIEKL